MTGKERCALLKQIRKEIAESNGIVYLTSDCPCDADGCKGSCPITEAEIRYIDSELNRRVENGGKISLAGITLDTYDNVTEKEINQSGAVEKKEGHPDILLDITIEELDFGWRVFELLKDLGVFDIRSLISYTKEEYRQFASGFSRRCAEEIEYKLNLWGFSLRENIKLPISYYPEKTMPLAALHLFPRTFMWLRLEKGIYDVQELLTKTIEELDPPHYRCRRDLVARLRTMGLSLRTEEETPR